MEQYAGFNKRRCGVLLPVFSLPSDYGIGTLGKEAYRFVDFLSSAGQDCWQMLPMGPTGYGDSPYQPFSSFAGNPYFIDLDILVEEGLLRKEELKNDVLGGCQGPVDYGRQYAQRYKILRKAWERYDGEKDEGLHEFADLNRYWLDDYTLFMALKDNYGGAAWTEWGADLRKRESSALSAARSELHYDIRFHMFLQHMFFRQFFRLRDYADSKGVKLIGDLPIYVAPDSADVWSNKQVFMLDEELKPELVAGVPPDAFSDDGQLWGNPVYDWDYLNHTTYHWWIERINHAGHMYTCIRIDHFRGFDEFWAVPQGSKNAVNGKWYKSGGKDFIDAVEKQCGHISIIAEDLGIITKRVESLRQYAGYPGMKVLQFAFDGNLNNPHLPVNYEHDCVAYTGTHDNDTLIGWLAGLSDECKAYIVKALNIEGSDSLAQGIIEALYGSNADLCILPLQDMLGIGSEGRINTPSVAWGNWTWRVDKNYSSRRLCEDIKSAVMKGSKVKERKNENTCNWI